MAGADSPCIASCKDQTTAVQADLEDRVQELNEVVTTPRGCAFLAPNVLQMLHQLLPGLGNSFTCMMFQPPTASKGPSNLWLPLWTDVLVRPCFISVSTLISRIFSSACLTLGRFDANHPLLPAACTQVVIPKPASICVFLYMT